MKMLNRQIRKIAREVFVNELGLYELDPAKNYILVLPTDLDPEETRAALQSIIGNVSIAVLHADHVKLVEVK